MKGKALALSLLCAAPLSGYAAEQLIPAGSLVQCTIDEPRLSSKTADVGDPVLCQVNHGERYGRFSLPYGSYLAGRFEEYKDPGHFVGKGWMELRFDRLIVPPDDVFPVAAKVVNVPDYRVDKQGRILGKGHPVRDVVEWSIPILWPIDLINLPRRGPRPTLKNETHLTLKLMDDLAVPQTQQASHDQYGFSHRSEPMAYTPQAPDPDTPPSSEPIASYGFAPPLPPEPLTTERLVRRMPPPVTVLILRGGYGMYATRYRFEGNLIRYIAMNGAPITIPARQLDLPRTVAINRQRGIDFVIPPPLYGPAY